MALRARLLRLLPDRRRPHLRTAMRRRSYPQGYRIESIGPDAKRRESREDGGI